MNFKNLFRKLLFLAFLFFYTQALFAQATRVTGTVTDGSTKETMPFVTVGFTGSSNYTNRCSTWAESFFALRICPDAAWVRRTLS